jgi:hypothetical protein
MAWCASCSVCVVWCAFLPCLRGMTCCCVFVCRPSCQLAVVVSSSGAVPHLIAALKHADAKLKRQVCALFVGLYIKPPFSTPAVAAAPCAVQACNALAQIAKHSVELAEVTVEAGLFPTYVWSAGWFTQTASDRLQNLPQCI